MKAENGKGERNEMKKLIGGLLAALLLMSAACQPTPTEEYVVNKKDSGEAAKLEKDTA